MKLGTKAIASICIPLLATPRSNRPIVHRLQRKRDKRIFDSVKRNPNPYQSYFAKRIRMRPQHWTAVATAVFTDVLPMMRRRHAATVYLVLYHYAWHTKEKTVDASMKGLCRGTGLDGRTVNACIRYLEWRRFIIRVVRGTPRSIEDLPVWQIPAARFNMRKAGWVPVPSLIFTDYLPVHSACVLLPLLLYYQNIAKQNECYPSVHTLRLMLGCWSVRMVYTALALLSKPARWDRVGPKLLLPLEVMHRRVENSKRVRHSYRVRAVNYHRENKWKPRVLYISREFQEFFDIHGDESPLPDYYYELIRKMPHGKWRPPNPFAGPV
jgi:hypothetical protein